MQTRFQIRCRASCDQRKMARQIWMPRCRVAHSRKLLINLTWNVNLVKASLSPSDLRALAAKSSLPPTNGRQTNFVNGLDAAVCPSFVSSPTSPFQFPFQVTTTTTMPVLPASLTRTATPEIVIEAQPGQGSQPPHLAPTSAAPFIIDHPLSQSQHHLHQPQHISVIYPRTAEQQVCLLTSTSGACTHSDSNQDGCLRNETSFSGPLKLLRNSRPPVFMTPPPPAYSPPPSPIHSYYPSSSSTFTSFSPSDHSFSIPTTEMTAEPTSESDVKTHPHCTSSYSSALAGPASIEEVASQTKKAAHLLDSPSVTRSPCQPNLSVEVRLPTHSLVPPSSLLVNPALSGMNSNDTRCPNHKPVNNSLEIRQTTDYGFPHSSSCLPVISRKVVTTTSGLNMLEVTSMAQSPQELHSPSIVETTIIHPSQKLVSWSGSKTSPHLDSQFYLR
ncbi:unnamed protein product [Protopolystoma xenopodis]|uniref:Uncharacterized protein n=1 Tax=Protopolystoma xenopodis TaxID=117903 RepID=A0A3S5AXM5_9PLAT|nr:unnamed protein product [Protopolystoma xenopodis]